MQYFTLQAASHHEALQKIREKYGENARILNHRNIRIGGFLGLFSREGVEVTGYISSEPLRRQKLMLEEEKAKILENVKKDQTLKTLLEEIKSLKKELKGTYSGEVEIHPTIKELQQLLRVNEFSEEFIKEASEWMEANFSLDDLKNINNVRGELLIWIGKKIKIGEPINFNVKPRIVTIIGPTGVGKTTTIAKLAAIYAIGNSKISPKSVRMITIDSYRIAAEQQIKKYGEIMKVPVAMVVNREEMRRALALYQDVDLILIDTIGKSPRDYEKLGEMKNILDVVGKKSDTYLAISATTKSSDLEDVIRHFEPFEYGSIILTKLDETNRVGNIISILHKKGKSVSYISDGQSVPQDFEEATVQRFLMNLEGFDADVTRMEREFGKKETLKGIWS